MGDPGCSASNDEHGILQRGRLALQPSGGQEWRHWESSGHPAAGQEINLAHWTTLDHTGPEAHPATALLNLTRNTYTGVRLHNAFSKKKTRKSKKITVFI